LGSYTASAAARAVDDAAAASACLVVGPGLGRGAGPTGAVLRAVQQHDAPLVLDADGLNLLAAMPAFTSDFHAAAVVTPHPGEFETMAKALGLPPRPRTPAERRAGAEGLAQRLGCVVVLKGAGTVVTDGQRTRVNTSGIDALATAGTGDVLAGLIGGLVAQFVSIPDPRPFPMPPKPRPPGKPLDLFEAACIAVHAHGLAAERWCTRHGARAGLLATELADEIPSALSALAALAPAAAP
jgi:NAD(P)H-hydrate epimerase